MNKNKKHIAYKIVTAVMVVTIIVLALYIMINQLGLIPGYDFGGGAYYYVDIPGFDQIVDQNSYHTSVPVWVHAVLFIAWGWVIWRLWLWIDRKSRKDDE